MVLVVVVVGLVLLRFEPSASSLSVGNHEELLAKRAVLVLPAGQRWVVAGTGNGDCCWPTVLPASARVVSSSSSTADGDDGGTRTVVGGARVVLSLAEASATACLWGVDVEWRAGKPIPVLLLIELDVVVVVVVVDVLGLLLLATLVLDAVLRSVEHTIGLHSAMQLVTTARKKTISEVGNLNASKGARIR